MTAARVRVRGGGGLLFPSLPVIFAQNSRQTLSLGFLVVPVSVLVPA